MKYHAKNLTNAPTVYHTQRGLFLHSRSSFYFRHKLYTSTISRIPTFRPSCSCFSFFRSPPGFLTLYALFSPIIIRAAPAAVRPDHGRKSSFCRYNHQLVSAHIQFLPPPALSPSAPRSLHKKQDVSDHMLPGGSHASEDFPQRKSPALCVHW